jgi:hypothetical protein
MQLPECRCSTKYFVMLQLLWVVTLPSMWDRLGRWDQGLLPSSAKVRTNCSWSRNLPAGRLTFPLSFAQDHLPWRYFVFRPSTSSVDPAATVTAQLHRRSSLPTPAVTDFASLFGRARASHPHYWNPMRSHGKDGLESWRDLCLTSMFSLPSSAAPVRPPQIIDTTWPECPTCLEM